MDQPSQQFADRYSLQLAGSWRSWFDRPHSFTLPGAFQYPVDLNDLTCAAPRCIWPGFMLPDSLPLIGNGYGDWLCVRIDDVGSPREIVHWYHGGGDWIPVGTTLEQAILHDVIDQFRPLQRQMLRGAGETLSADHLEQVQQHFRQAAFQDWLRRGLAGHAHLDQLIELLDSGQYLGPLVGLQQQGWAIAAATCDLIEAELQTTITEQLQLVGKEVAQGDQRSMARFLFDPHRYAPRELAIVVSSDWPTVDWSRIEQLCSAITSERSDLAWAYELLGWCQHRKGELEQAADTYFAGRLAASFTNQAVRLRTHWFNQKYGKFAIAQLFELGEAGRHWWENDPYLQLFPGNPGDLLNRVTAFWERLGEEHLASARFAEAYDCFVRAGWDLGAPTIADYGRILASIVAAATGAGWHARATIAETHLRCLRQRRPVG